MAIPGKPGRHAARLGAALVAAVLALGCDDAETTTESASRDDGPAPATTAVTRSPVTGLGQTPDWQACAKQHASIRQQPASPGAPQLEARRAELVGRVRGATVLWKRPPKLGDLSDDLRKSVTRLEQSEEPLDAIRELIADRRRDRPKLRSALLREGYLFVPSVEAALAVVQQVGLTHLHDEPTVHLLRDGTVHRLERGKVGRKARYVHADGPRKGEAAELLFADRVGLDAAALTRNTLAVDFSAAQETAGFERIRAAHLTTDWLAAEVRYGAETWVPAVFDVRGPSARLQCHALTAETARAVAAAQAAALRSGRVQARIREVAHAQVREQIPFDVARAGTGDDSDRFPLRARWKEAYDEGRRSFRLRGKTYPVYDEEGRPLVPQVCLEFAYDTWERASGTWYQPATPGEPEGPLRPQPKRIVGGLTIDALKIKHRRRVSKFLDYAEDHPETFDVWLTPKADRIPFARHGPFFAMLAKHADQFRRGDLLIVSRFKQTKRARYHTMIVIETDPFVGVPTLVAGNAAKPRIQTIDGVMEISPRRYLKMRIRPQASWLDAAVLKHLDGD